MSALAARLSAMAQNWSRGRRAVVPAGLLALIAAVAASGLVAAADEPARSKAADRSPHSRPKYLQPVGALVRQRWLPGPTLTGDNGTVGVPSGTPNPPTTPDPRRAAQQAPAIAAYGGRGGTISPAGIATLALRAGCGPESAIVATAIAMAESGGSPGAQGDIGLMDSVWDWSAGLWQIRGLRSERNTGGLRDSVANQAVGKNAAAMHEISQGCTTWTPWSTYDTGAYLPFMALARQAVGYVVRWFNAHGHHYPPVPAPDPNATIPTGGAGHGGGAGAAAAGPAARPSTRPHPHSSATAPTHRAAAPRRSAAAPAASTTQPAGGPSRTGAGGQLPRPTSSSTPKLPVPLPTTATLPLPLPTPSLPKLPSPSLP